MEERTPRTTRCWRTIKHHWLTVSFVLGFISDSLLLNQVDSVVDGAILTGYVVIATVSLPLFYLGVTGRMWFGLSVRAEKYIPLVMQYVFGGIFSGMLIFYGRSGDWLSSSPVLLVIVALVLANELLQKRSDRLVYYLLSYFFGIFLFLILMVPVLLGKMGPWVFLLSGILALILQYSVVRLLAKIIPHFIALQMRWIVFGVGLIYAVLNALYFANIIPPIPLSLTELSVVQTVTRSGPEYLVTYEKQSWLDNWDFWRTVIHPVNGEVSCFARVYAPTRLETKVYQEWDKKDPKTGEWVRHFRLGYNITGANRDGYGGYTTIGSFSEGLWRCSVKTERGQVLGREVFHISNQEPGTLLTESR